MDVVDKPEELGLSGQRLARIVPFFQERYVDTGKLAGVVTLVARNGRIAHLGSCGRRALRRVPRCRRTPSSASTP